MLDWRFWIHFLLVFRLADGWQSGGVLPVDSDASNGDALHYIGKFCFQFHPAGQNTTAVPGNQGANVTANAGKNASEPTEDNETTGSVSFKVQGTVNLMQGLVRKQPAQDPYVHFTSAPESKQGLYLAIFDDKDEGKWKHFRSRWVNDNLNCTEFLNLSTSYFAVAPTADSFKTEFRIQRLREPRFFHFTLALCGAKFATPIAYTLHARNHDNGNVSEFSADESSAFTCQQVGFAGFSLLFASSYGNARWTKGQLVLRGRLPLRFLLASCALSAVGCLSLIIHFSVYASNGVGLGFFAFTGQFSACIARVMLNLLLLFMARGKALLNPREKACRQLYLQGLVVSTVLVDVCCELYGRYFGSTDWSTLLHFYESRPGFFVLVLKVLLFLEVATATRSLVKKYRYDRKAMRLYRTTLAAASCYFAALPMICLFARFFQMWERKMIVDHMEVFVRFLATMALAFWFRPSRLDADHSEYKNNDIELSDTLHSVRVGPEILP